MPIPEGIVPCVALPSVGIQMGVLLLMMYMPGLVLWLPKLMKLVQ